MKMVLLRICCDLLCLCRAHLGRRDTLLSGEGGIALLLPDLTRHHPTRQKAWPGWSGAVPKSSGPGSPGGRGVNFPQHGAPCRMEIAFPSSPFSFQVLWTGQPGCYHVKMAFWRVKEKYMERRKEQAGRGQEAGSNCCLDHRAMAQLSQWCHWVMGFGNVTEVAPFPDFL